MGVSRANFSSFLANRKKEGSDMGHSWREMDPSGADAHDAYIERRRALCDAFANVPLGHFTVSELGPIMRLNGLEYGFSGARDCTREDFRVLAAAADRLEIKIGS